MRTGVEALTRYLAGIGGKHNIRVNCVRPGQIMTEGATGGTIHDSDGGHHVFEQWFDRIQIFQGPGYPEDAANLVLFLTSDESRFINSDIINVDGGCALGTSPGYKCRWSQAGFPGLSCAALIISVIA